MARIAPNGSIVSDTFALGRTLPAHLRQLGLASCTSSMKSSCIAVAIAVYVVGDFSGHTLIMALDEETDLSEVGLPLVESHRRICRRPSLQCRPEIREVLGHFKKRTDLGGRHLACGLWCDSLSASGGLRGCRRPPSWGGEKAGCLERMASFRFGFSSVLATQGAVAQGATFSPDRCASARSRRNRLSFATLRNGFECGNCTQTRTNYAQPARPWLCGRVRERTRPHQTQW